MEKNYNTPVSKFLNKFFHYLDNTGLEPVEDSPASIEINSFERRESIETAFSIALQSFISATDHLEAFDTLLYMEHFAMAPWSCARGMIEALAISTWLLESGIGPKERVSRSLSLRYTTFREQEKKAKYEGNLDLVQIIRDRIESVEKIAVDLGFPIFRDKREQRKGIAQTKPTITALIEQQFKGENLYRTLSGMAHSDYTSLTTFSFPKRPLEVGKEHC
jgi:hypothetical protein